MKNNKNIIILTVLVLFLGSCTRWYKTVELNEISKESISVLSEYKPLVTLENDEAVFNLAIISVSDDSIKGVLSSTLIDDHSAGKRVFLTPKTAKAKVGDYWHSHTA